MVTGAVVLAAGLSSRMKEFKPMLRLGETTIIRQVVGTLRDTGVHPIVVVTGYKSETLRRHLAEEELLFVENPDYAATQMLDSVKLGLAALEGLCDRVLIQPGDIPLIRRETLGQLLAQPGKLVVPSCGGRRGHPLLVSSELLPLLRTYQGDRGLRGALEHLPAELEYLCVDDSGVLLDVDTPDDYSRLLYEDGIRRNSDGTHLELQVLLKKKEVILSPEIVQFLELVDHTGSLQMASDCMHISYSKGWNMVRDSELQLKCALLERSPGGANGGGSRLSPQGRSLVQSYRAVQTEARAMVDALYRKYFG